MTFKRLHRTLLLSTLALLTASFGASAQGRDIVVVSDTTTTSAQASARIDFKVNLINVDNDYHGNDAQLEKVLSEIDLMVLNPRMKVERITVVGTASPEGPYRNNVRLATGRANAFIKILQSRYSFPDSIYAVSTIPEDWEGMRMMLTENTSIPYAEVVLRFLDETEQLNPNTRETRLKQLDGGQPYKSMLDNVLPYLRRASVLVDYDTEWIRRHHILPPVELTMPTLDVSFTLPEIHPLPIQWPERKQRFFAIKTNLLGDLALCANLGFEVELWPHWSLDVPVWYSPYDITDRWRIRLLAVQPEMRYWLKDVGKGHYFGVHTTVAGFNVSFNGDWKTQARMPPEAKFV